MEHEKSEPDHKRESCVSSYGLYIALHAYYSEDFLEKVIGFSSVAIKNAVLSKQLKAIRVSRGIYIYKGSDIVDFLDNIRRE